MFHFDSFLINVNSGIVSFKRADTFRRIGHETLMTLVADLGTHSLVLCESYEVITNLMCLLYQSGHGKCVWKEPFVVGHENYNSDDVTNLFDKENPSIESQNKLNQLKLIIDAFR